MVEEKIRIFEINQDINTKLENFKRYATRKCEEIIAIKGKEKTQELETFWKGVHRKMAEIGNLEDKYIQNGGDKE